MTTFAPSRPGMRDAFPPHTVLPGDDGYDQARVPWNVAVDLNPAAVVYPETAAEMAQVVRATRAAGLRLATAPTGHNLSAIGDMSETVLMWTSRMRGVHLDADRLRARAEAGAIWEDVVVPAAAMGMSVLHGSSPDVGVVGYSLGGGIGWQARKRGLATNSITAIELITADGEMVRADARTEPDLFWAMRGGGGNFGVVTALEFAMYPMTSVYAGWLIFPWERSDEVLHAWSEWTRDAPEEVTSVGRILQLPPLEIIPEPLRGRNIVVVEAAFLGDEAAGRALMAPLRDLGPEMDTFAVVGPEGLARLHQDPEGPTPAIGTGALLDHFGPEAVDAFLSVAGPGSGSTLLSMEVRHADGARGRPHPGGGALSHVDARYVSFAVSLPMGPESAIAIDAHLRRYTEAMAPFGRGRNYLNFAEQRVDTSTLYGETAYDRLQRIRAQVDPDGFLHANHQIPRAR